jgi:hypothetical protein
MLSDSTYIAFHTKLTSEETLRAKHAFEAHAETLGVQVRNYHADNGWFQDLLFKEDSHQKGSREEDQRPTRCSKDFSITCYRKMTKSDNCEFMALCHEAC